MVCGLPAALLAIVKMADWKPRSSAKNATAILQLLRTASDRGQRLSAKNSRPLARVPGVTEMLDIDTGMVPVFVTVTVVVRSRKRGTVPKDTLFGATFSCAIGGLTVIEQATVLVPNASPDESVTCPVKAYVPAVVGVPEMAPVLGLTVRPAGRLPPEIEKPYGETPPDAVNAELYATPTPAVAAAQVSVRGATY